MRRWDVRKPVSKKSTGDQAISTLIPRRVHTDSTPRDGGLIRLRRLLITASGSLTLILYRAGETDSARELHRFEVGPDGFADLCDLEGIDNRAGTGEVDGDNAELQFQITNASGVRWSVIPWAEMDGQDAEDLA